MARQREVDKQAMKETDSIVGSGPSPSTEQFKISRS